jgi:hypothetical protein
MTHGPLRRFLVAFLAATACALAAPYAGAQTPPQPTLSPDEQISPRQVQTIPTVKPKPRPAATRAVPPPAAAPADDAGTAPRPNPAPSAAAATAPAAAPAAPAAPSAPAAPKPAAAAHAVVACSGAFAKDSSHLKLMQAYQPKNVEYGEVAGAGGSKLNATILFPKDPKRHLEVLWGNEAARSDTSLIVITGQSTWTGPKGLKLGLTLAALEKLNGKPFKLSGFDQPEGSAVTDWQGGALANLPGGCKVGVKLAADRKAAADALAAAAGTDLGSDDAKIRAVKPTVAEIIFGY